MNTRRQKIEPIDSQKLLAFYTLAQVNSFTEAGRLLRLTQSAVSHAVARLESDLETRLVWRGWRTSTLTKAGVVLLRHAEAIFGEMQRTRESMEAFRDPPSSGQ